MFLVNVPWSDLQVPFAAPAVLKGIAESQGYSIKTHDFTIDFKYKFCNGDQSLFEETQDYFTALTDNNYKFQPVIEEYYNYIADVVKNTKCRFFGISVFGLFTHKATFEICRRIRELAPEITIVIGGKGASVQPHISITRQLTMGERMLDFGKVMSKRKLADHVILGDAEDAIIDLLAGRFEQAKESFNVPKINNLEYPFSNFDDYQLDYYQGVFDRVQLPVVSSKGCVRSCDFCDVGAQFQRFQSKSGRRLAEEMIYLYERYDIREFTLADSIANGNMKSLRECCEILAEYNSKVPEDKKIIWIGNWIARPPMMVKPDFFDLMAQSCDSVVVGAEHGSDAVLDAMNKKTNVAGLYYELNEMSRVGIQAALNNITGHWAETYDDFLKNVDMLLNLGPLCASQMIPYQNLGTGFAVLKGTPAADNTLDSGLIAADDNFTYMWYTKRNPNLTVKARMSRLYFVYRMAMKLNMPLYLAYGSLLNIYSRLTISRGEWQEFYEQYVDPAEYVECPSIELINQVDEYVAKRIPELYPKTKLTIVADVDHYNGAPRLIIKNNGSIIYSNELPKGRNEISVDVEYDYTCPGTIEIGMDNKDVFDTGVDEAGNITADKKIDFKSIVVDGVDIYKNLDYYYQQTKYMDQGEFVEFSKPGLYSNSSLLINYEAPFWRYYLQVSPSTTSWQVNSDPDKAWNLLHNLKKEIETLHY